MFFVIIITVKICKFNITVSTQILLLYYPLWCPGLQRLQCCDFIQVLIAAMCVVTFLFRFEQAVLWRRKATVPSLKDNKIWITENFHWSPPFFTALLCNCSCLNGNNLGTLSNLFQNNLGNFFPSFLYISFLLCLFIITGQIKLNPCVDFSIGTMVICQT